MNRFCIHLILIFSLCGTAVSHNFLKRQKFLSASDPLQQRELLFLPDPDLARSVSLGYQTVLADLIWFKTISYFGTHIEGDRNIRHLDTFCSSILALNPKARHVSLFCAQMLAWELKNPQRARGLLTLSIQHYPNDWMLFYLRGFFSLHFLKNKKEAQIDLMKAASIEDSPAIIKRLAATQIASLDGDEQAIIFLDILISRTSDEATRASLQQRRDELMAKFRTNAANSPRSLPKERNGT
jgi:hypothetical protein